MLKVSLSHILCLKDESLQFLMQSTRVHIYPLEPGQLLTFSDQLSRKKRMITSLSNTTDTTIWPLRVLSMDVVA